VYELVVVEVPELSNAQSEFAVQVNVPAAFFQPPLPEHLVPTASI